MKALIFCAGEGRRMRPLSLLAPKPLITVGGVPMAVRQILALREAGIREFVINAAHGARILQAELGDGSAWGVRIDYSVEGYCAEEALETLGGIVKALPLLRAGGEAFIAVAGDIVSDYDYRTLAARAEALSAGHAAHFVLVPNPSYHPEGDFRLEDGIVREKCTKSGEALTYASIGAFHASLFEYLPVRREKLFPWMLDAVRAERVTGEKFSGAWANVGTPEELGRAEALFAQGAREMAGRSE